MPETREPQSVIDAAEQAASAGDYAAAEQLLREAALLQEASLGPLHPDLANTLNNLGVVCEITEKPDDAEACFRRACAIASSVLEPDHPFVATSRKNLEDFCAARGKAVDSPEPSVSVPLVSPDADPSPAVSADQLEAPAIEPDERPAEHTSREESRPAESRTSHEESRPVASRKPYEEPAAVESRKSSRPLAIGALIAGALILTFIATFTWLRSNHNVESSPASPRVSPGSPPTAAASPPPATVPDVPKETGSDRGPAPTAGPKPGATTPPPSTDQPVSESSSLPAAVAKKPITATSPKSPLVATAQLCKDFSTGGSDWHCIVPASPVGQGRLVFYTRLKSPAATTIQHRWYRDDRLRQAVELPIRANTTDGYRTYSRQTVDNRGAGNWRVELRTKDGVLLHEERFVVR
jgi:hypothetical protein